MMIDEVKSYTLDDIYSKTNIKEELLSLRMELIKNLECDRISRKVILDNPTISVNELEELLETIYIDSTSTLYFPNDLCCFYPKITEQKAKTIKTCDISGSIIMPNSSYYSYRPMLDNLTTGKTYVLKRTIQTEVGYYDFFPKTLYEFEELSMKLGSPFEIEDPDYDYYDLSKRLGQYLSLTELKKSKKKVKK